MAQLLPDDTLACILGRLTPRSLAAARCVCKSWCAVINDRRLLRTDLLPFSLHGILILERLSLAPLKFFANPLTRRRIAAAEFSYVDTEYQRHLELEDHCNGLLCLRDYKEGQDPDLQEDKLVVNPATRQWARLPPPPPSSAAMECFCYQMCLAFDPTVSPYNEVLLIHRVPWDPRDTAMFAKETEWPPSPYAVPVFSSRTWTWEERLLVRRGEPAGTIADMQSKWVLDHYHRYVVYWKGAIYVHCQNDSIMCITLLDSTYEMIKSPTGGKMDESTRLYLGKSMKGVYCALLSRNRRPQLQVWLLTQSSGKLEWRLNIDISLVPMVTRFSCVSADDENTRPLILHEGNYCDEDAKEDRPVQDNFEWDFDDDGIILDAQEKVECTYRLIYFLGFRPYKEIVFLLVSGERAVAYNFSSSKVHDMGRLPVKYGGDSFPYTPCWTAKLFEKS